MKTEAKEGDEILVSGSIEVMPGPRGSGKARIRFSEHEVHWFHLDTLIPIPEPLPAPTCAGPWSQELDGEIRARDVFKLNGDLGYRLVDGSFSQKFYGTWRKLDPRLVGVEVEEAKGVEPIVGVDPGCADGSRTSYQVTLQPEEWEKYRVAKATLETLHPDIGDRKVMEQLFFDRFTGSGVDKILDTIYRDKPKPEDPRDEFAERAQAIIDQARVDLSQTARELLAELTPPPPGDTPRKS